MKNRNPKLLISLVIVAVALFADANSIFAQHGGTTTKTNTRILYHDGPVMQGTSNIYLIFYGNWGGDTAPAILIDLASTLGSTPYFRINTTYPDANGGAPNGALVYAGSVYDSYSRGPILTELDIENVIADQITANRLPLDPVGIYLVAASADVTDIRNDGSTFCTPGTSPLHGHAEYVGFTYKYGYIGAGARCPTSVGAQFPGQLSPNGNFSADTMANQMARLLNVIVTSPLGTDGPRGGWYDRYGLENADKCVGNFGTIYQAPNGAPANLRIRQRDFLLQQNWVNDRKGYCSLSYP